MIILVKKTLIIFAHGVIIFIIFKSLYSSQIAKFPYRKTLESFGWPLLYIVDHFSIPVKDLSQV